MFITGEKLLTGVKYRRKIISSVLAIGDKFIAGDVTPAITPCSGF
jgi:hypothetical protein